MAVNLCARVCAQVTDLPPDLLLSGFTPALADKDRLLAVESELRGMIESGRACDAASDPFPKPLRLFPVFLTALESRVRAPAALCVCVCMLVCVCVCVYACVRV